MAPNGVVCEFPSAIEPFVTVNDSATPGTKLLFAASTLNHIETDSSLVIVEANGPPIRVVGIPGWTMIVWVTITLPKRADIVTFPI